VGCPGGLGGRPADLSRGRRSDPGPPPGTLRRPAATPAQLLAIDEDTLRGVGLSHAKAVYLHDLAARLVDGRLDLARLSTLDDDAARDTLTQVKGVGRFTADGVLLLTLRRPDIWPAADLALRRAVARVWELAIRPSLADVDALGERFRPWRTLAAVYLLTHDRRDAIPRAAYDSLVGHALR
jgi:DNA-3-methyladenine glycosylase II